MSADRIVEALRRHPEFFLAVREHLGREHVFGEWSREGRFLWSRPYLGCGRRGSIRVEGLSEGAVWTVRGAPGQVDTQPDLGSAKDAVDALLDETGCLKVCSPPPPDGARGMVPDVFVARLRHRPLVLVEVNRQMGSVGVVGPWARDSETHMWSRGEDCFLMPVPREDGQGLAWRLRVSGVFMSPPIKSLSEAKVRMDALLLERGFLLRGGAS